MAIGGFDVRKVQRELIRKVLKRAPFDRRCLSPLFTIFFEDSHMEPTQKVAERKGSIPESIMKTASMSKFQGATQ